jgi:hypothetical protein
VHFALLSAWAACGYLGLVVMMKPEVKAAFTQ